MADREFEIESDEAHPNGQRYIRFLVDIGGNSYRDAFTVPVGTTNAQMKVMARQRFDRWRENVNKPPTVDPTFDERQRDLEGRQQILTQEEEQLDAEFQGTSLQPEDEEGKAWEIKRNLRQISRFGSLAVVTLKVSTAAENATALRQAYKDAARLEAIMIGDYLASLTNAQLRAAFDLTLAQVTTLRTNKLTPAANIATAIRAAAGA